MRASQYLLVTLKETPADAEIISQQLMLRAGLIRKLGSGLYTWLPLGLRVLRKVEQIIREELNRINALELLMPAIQPAELWEESDRWDKFGPLLLKILDRHQRPFCFGPTHEEVITDLARKELRSYKQLPITLYQIQTKFRDEIRPRFGVMRAREFLMKDAYSFHINAESLEQTYQKMYEAYSRIFTRLGLTFRAVLADTGSIGGAHSHEFQVLANSGEDQIVYSDGSDYAANMEMANAKAPEEGRPAPTESMRVIDTPNKKTIDEVSQFLGVKPSQCVKTLIVKGRETPLVALVIRGDHELNEIKAEKLDEVAVPLTFASDEEIAKEIHCFSGYLGPVGLNIPLIADRDCAHLSDFVTGANQNNKHFQYVNWGRDLDEPQIASLRKAVEGDLSPDGKGVLKITRGIEVGHIFQLGNKYSVAMNATVLDEQGQSIPMEMGCYGIGVSRIVAAAIEQHHDDNGIIWTDAMAPFVVALLPMQMAKSERVRAKAEELYISLKNASIEVLFDDRNERPGVMFSQMDLIGIPHRLVLGERGLDAGVIEYKHRTQSESENIPLDEIIPFLKNKIDRSL